MLFRSLGGNAVQSASFTLGLQSNSTSSSGNTNVGLYEIVASNQSKLTNNYDSLVFSNGYLTVNTKELTPSTSGVTKVYDGSTTVRGVSVDISGKVSGDEVIIGNSGGSFASKNVGSGINYTIYGLLMSGLDAGNYHLSTGSISGNGSITAKDRKSTRLNSSH